MGKRTFLTGEDMTLTTAVDVLAAFQTAAAGTNLGQTVKVTRVEITQSAATTGGQIRGAMSLRNTSGTLTTTSKAPQPNVYGGSASGLSGNTNVLGGTARSGINASVDSGGTYSNDRYFNFSQLNGYLFKPDGYGEELVILPSTVFVVRFLADPGNLAGWTICIDLDET
jgi:hypothetical protein